MVNRRKIRQLSTCKRKVRYPAKRVAEAVLWRISSRKNDFSMHTYYCDWCHGYHIGHMRGRKNR